MENLLSVENEFGESFFSSLVASATEAVVSKTREGIITSWNLGAERLFGYKAVEAIGKPIFLIIPPDRYEEEFGILNRQLADRGIDNLDTVRLRNDGTRLRVSISVFPIRDPRGVMLGIGKVARRAQSENSYVDAIQGLLLQEAAGRREAEAAVDGRDRFLATLSHELRSPLNAILGWATILGQDDLPASDKTQAIEVIKRSARQQARLIEDILDISRIITGKLRLESFHLNLADSARAAVKDILPLAEQMGIVLECEIPHESLAVAGDPNRLQQVLLNLLSNAVKFTSSGGTVRLEVKSDGRVASVIITDSGIGIDRRLLPQIFEQFRQGEQIEVRRGGGLGLGLAIVRHIVEGHGGRVWADSEGEGLGSVFTFELPLLGASLRESTTQLEDGNGSPSCFQLAGGTLSGLRVLAVDDDEDALQILRIVLEKSGAEVFIARNAEEAFTNILSFRPAVIVSDIGMPGEDGFTFMERIRQSPESGGLRSVALTAFAGEVVARRVLEAGFDVYLAKPVEPDLLVETVKNLVIP